MKIPSKYIRRKFRSEVEAADSMPVSTSEVCPSTIVHEIEPQVIYVSSTSEVNVEDPSSNDVPIALRKGTRSKAGLPPSRYGYEHDISIEQCLLL